MFLMQQENPSFYQFVVKCGREDGFDHLLRNLNIPEKNIKKRIDKGGAVVFLLDIYSLPNHKELRQSLNKAQVDFI